VLTFIGAQMIAHKWMDIPEYLSLLIVVGILLVALAASLLFPARNMARKGRHTGAD
jgi:predicted tellurium resistance membrane protein TerC